MAQETRIMVLAQQIQTHTSLLNDYLLSNNLSSPSFDANFKHTANLPEEISASSKVILDATEELHQLVLGPLGFLFHLVDGIYNIASLHAISRFNMASMVPADGQASITSVADNAKLSEDDTRSIIKHAATNRIFKHTGDESVQHTAASKTLAEMPYLTDFIVQSCAEMGVAMPSFADALERWSGSQEPQHSAYSLAQRTDRSFFQELETYPDRLLKFTNSMTLFTSLPGFEVDRVLEIYDWKPLQAATIVDVGGGHGAVATTIAKAYPSMKWTVQDKASIIDSAQRGNSELGAQNVTFQVHDFFGEQPVKYADAYFLRMILHDWPDDYCVRILRNLIPALKDGAKILINDFCLPPFGLLSTRDERNARCHDLAMKAVFNSKERDAQDWIKLFSRADPRLGSCRVHAKPSSAMALLELSWKGA